MPRKDDERKVWLIVGIFFTAGLAAMDIFYSAFGQMSNGLQWVAGIMHVGLMVAWLTAMIKFKDPKYDTARYLVVGLCIILALIVGIHKATSKEDKQVIIDSKENAAKP